MAPPISVLSTRLTALRVRLGLIRSIFCRLLATSTLQDQKSKRSWPPLILAGTYPSFASFWLISPRFSNNYLAFPVVFALICIYNAFYGAEKHHSFDLNVKPLASSNTLWLPLSLVHVAQDLY